MAKILKNQTGSDIELSNVGLSIPAFGQLTIDIASYILLASDDSITELTTLINSGDIIVNDGSSDLSPNSEAIAFLRYPDDATNIKFTPTAEISGNTVQEAIGDGVATALNTPRFSIPLIFNGAASNNEFIGYSNLLPGDSTPIVIPINSVLEEYSFSNSKTTADYTIELRKNSTTATLFNTISKVNTKSFVQSGIEESFSSGDHIYIKYIDNGVNASDIAILLILRALP